ncbi:zinc knuckle [Phlyctema vagabunda]|uniref:Zinc knuckle n=1 Tax=Phlyctema vagabunda TaxID=108571 RepID=A0ABR4PR57_9HELO
MSSGWDNTGGGGDSWETGAATTAGDDNWGGGSGATEQWGAGGANSAADTGDAQFGGNYSGDASVNNGFTESGAGGGGGGGGGRGACFNCGEEGAPPKLCNNCGEAGHGITDCQNPRKIDRSNIADVKAEEAWDALKVASDARDLDDIKTAAFQYIKATPDATYPQLEKAFRGQGLSIYLIAVERGLTMTYTNMDLQGNLGKKYTVTWRLSPNPKRPKEREGWPTSPEENMVRLDDAGEAVEKGVPKCSNCNELGHTFKSCPEEKQENADRAVVKCINCEQLGHRSRDCPTPRPDKFACRNCKQSGHTAKECPEPRSAEGVECKKCNEIGHFSRDCPQGGSGVTCHNCGEEGHRSKECEKPKKIICRNCDAEGHTGKECPKPRDWSRVKCNNCGQMGHGQRGCKEPPAEDYAGGDYGGDGGAGYATGAGGFDNGGGNFDNGGGFNNGGGDFGSGGAHAIDSNSAW